MAADFTNEDFFEAANDGDDEKLKTILESIDGIIDVQNEVGNTALHLSLGHSKCTKLLISYGANKTITNNAGFTPFQEAARRDLVESLIQLLINGCDLNGQTENAGSIEESKLPIVLAAQNKSFATRDLLLFCGARVPNDGLSDITPDEKNKHDQIKTGFKDGKIVFGSTTLRCNSVSKTTIDNIGIVMKLANSEQEDVEFICRRVNVGYQTSSTGTAEIIMKDKETLISDIYQYRANRGALCDMTIPIHCDDIGSLKTYYDVYIRQITYTNYSDSESQIDHSVALLDETNKLAKFTDVPLMAYSEGSIVSLGVISKTKVESTSLDPNIKQVMRSTVNTRFKVTKPAGALEHADKLALEVIKVDNGEQSQSSSDDSSSEASSSGVSSMTDFHSVSTEGENRPTTIDRQGSAVSGFSKEDDIYIELPRPTLLDTEDSRPVLIGNDQDANPAETSDWTERVYEGSSRQDTLTFKGRCGRFIVVMLKGPQKVGFAIREMIKDLYLQLTGQTVKCRLFTAVKNENGQMLHYLVRVVLCTEKEFETEKSKLGSFVVQTEECLKDKKFLKTKPYFMYFDIYTGCGSIIEDENVKPIQYQTGMKHVEFKVEKKGEQQHFGCIKVFKTRMETKEYRSRQPKYKLQVYFKMKDRERRDKFPSSKFITDVSRMIGDAYFPLGIYLGMDVTLLQDMRDQGREECSRKILHYWLDTMYSKKSRIPDALKRLFFALKEAERHKVRTSFVREINEKCDKNSPENQWLKGFIKGQDKNGATFNFNEISEDLKVSPFDDVFLYIVAKKLGHDGYNILPQLDSGSDASYVIDQREPDATRKKIFEVLYKTKCRDGSHPQLKYIENLFKALRNNNMNLHRKRLNKILEPWYSKDIRNQIGGNYNERTRTEIIKIMSLIDLT